MEAAVPLSAANLSRIAAAAGHTNLELPRYARGADAPRVSEAATAPEFGSLILHVGVGGFHRSHEAYVTHQLLQQQADAAADAERWGIVGVGLMPWDVAMRDALRDQDWMYVMLLLLHFPSNQCNDVASLTGQAVTKLCVALRPGTRCCCATAAGTRRLSSGRSPASRTCLTTTGAPRSPRSRSTRA